MVKSRKNKLPKIKTSRRVKKSVTRKSRKSSKTKTSRKKTSVKRLKKSYMRMNSNKRDSKTRHPELARTLESRYEKLLDQIGFNSCKCLHRSIASGYCMDCDSDTNSYRQCTNFNCRQSVAPVKVKCEECKGMYIPGHTGPVNKAVDNDSDSDY